MNIMMIGMLSLISNPLVHSTCTASLLLFALFLPRLIYRNLFPARRRRRWSRSRKPEKWRVHPGKGGGLSFSPSLRKERMEGTTEVEMGPKLVPPPFPPRSVGRSGGRTSVQTESWQRGCGQRRLEFSAVFVCSLKNVSHPTLCPGQCGSLYSERGVGVDLMKQRCSDPS